MNKFKVLWSGKFCSIISPENAPYEAMHENDGVFILPILNDKIGIRLEYCPPYFVKSKNEKLYYTVISGTIDNNQSKLQTIIKELKEEAGIKVKNFKILYSKLNIPECKSNTRRINIFIIKLIDYDLVKAIGDGTLYEKKSKTLFVTLDELENIVKNKKNIDFLLLSSYFILNQILSNNK